MKYQGLKNLNGLKGFTLIELVVVIVILGVLAAVAVPKFVDLQSEARTAVVQGVEGAIRGSATLIYSKALIEGKESAATENVTISSSGTVDTVYGYPASTAAGIEVAVDLSGGDISGASAAGVTTYTYTGFTNCQLTYTQSASDGAAPAIVVTTTGC